VRALSVYVVLISLFLPRSAAFWSLAYILSDKRAKQEITEEVFSLFNKKDTGREVPTRSTRQTCELAS
jgi:hypothetical protein